MEKHIMGENGISYTLGEDGLYYPDLYLPEETEYPIGKYSQDGIGCKGKNRAVQIVR